MRFVRQPVGVEAEVASAGGLGLLVDDALVARVLFLAFPAEELVNFLPCLVVGVEVAKECWLKVADVADNVVDSESLYACFCEDLL